MQFFDAEQVAHSLPWPELIAAIERTLTAEGADAPERTAHQVPVPGEPDASLLLKPGWIIGEVIAVKAVTFFPENGARSLPTVNAGVLLFDAKTGVFRGACDGNELTTRRTAAASAVAAKHLARRNAARLLVVGTGALAPMVAEAHCAVRDYTEVQIWGRSDAKAAAVASGVTDAGIPASPVHDLDEAVAAADTITCVTGATEPLVRGVHVSPGTHIDLIGSFTPQMRETDDEVIRKADVWVDTRHDGVLAGDLAQPMAAGLLRAEELQGDLRELIAGTCPRRLDDDQITLFKSAGTALEDVAAADLIFDRA